MNQKLQNRLSLLLIAVSIAAVVIIAFSNQELGNAWHALTVGGSTHAPVWMLKLILLLLDFCIAFFSFAMSIRV